MKFAIVVLACVVAAANAQFRNPGRPFASAFGSAQKASPFRYQPSPPPVPVAAPAYNPVRAVVNQDARNANILKSGNDINPDGSYSYFYETDNGIAAQEQGTPRNFGGNPPVVPDVAQGSFSWTSPEGEVVSISYVADENGYQPQGAHIPTPPPVPAQIARALEYIAKNAPRQ
ncbi:larval cuticle protein LCP-22-like [Ostrinia nubilalis]